MVELDLQHGDTGQCFVGEDLIGDAGMTLMENDIQVSPLGPGVEDK
jgi:hypothetical protein